MARRPRRESTTRAGKTFDADFMTPLSEPKPSRNVGPDVFNIPTFAPADPLGYCPGGNAPGSIRGDD
jgi:hypothetical protein